MSLWQNVVLMTQTAVGTPTEEIFSILNGVFLQFLELYSLDQNEAEVKESGG